MVRSPKNKPYNKAKHCKNCSKTGHLEAECWQKHPELQPKLKKAEPYKKPRKEPYKAERDRSSILIASNPNIEPYSGLYFILDSGATEHCIRCCETRIVLYTFFSGGMNGEA
jgi:hypothetical protein